MSTTVCPSMSLPGGTCTTVPTVTVPTPGPAVTPHVVTVAHAASTLPFTGADFETLVVIGGTALVAGLALMFRRRHAH